MSTFLDLVLFGANPFAKELTLVGVDCGTRGLVQNHKRKIVSALGRKYVFKVVSCFCGSDDFSSQAFSLQL